MKEESLTENYICSNNQTGNLGYNALYDVMLQSELPESSIVVGVINEKDRYIFQTLERIDVFAEDMVYVTVGTLAMFTPTELVLTDREIDTFYIRNLRFPTEKELELYAKLDTV